MEGLACKIKANDLKKTKKIIKETIPKKNRDKKATGKAASKIKKTGKKVVAQKDSDKHKKISGQETKEKKPAAKKKVGDIIAVKSGEKKRGIITAPIPAQKPLQTKTKKTVKKTGNEKLKNITGAKTTQPFTAKQTKLSKRREVKTVKRVLKRPVKNIRELRDAELPMEYGENELLLMVVDPNVIYASWEIKKEDIQGEKSALAMRIFDVTGGGSGGGKSESFFDIRIGERVGSGFFSIMRQGRDIIAEIGFPGAGRRFRPVLRSALVSLPQPLPLDEMGIVHELFESDIPVGY